MALVTFGLLSDVQYADIDNQPSFHGTLRHYRNSLVLLKEAIETWNAHNNSPANVNNKVSFILNLGDIIDGKNKDKSEEAVDRVLLEFKNYKDGPVHHLLGNHCLYHLTRDILHPKYSSSHSPSEGSAVMVQNAHHYYSFTPHPSIKIIILDSYDISILGWPPGHPNLSIANQILDKYNPNKEKNSANGMKGDQIRYVAYNGGIGPTQMAWLSQQLEDSLLLHQKVVVCSHVPLIQVYSDGPSFLWNYDEVLSLFKKYPNVVATLAGHEHDGGYIFKNNIHHFIVPAIVECVPGSNSFATVEIFDDHMQINGSGIIESKKLPFTYK